VVGAAVGERPYVVGSKRIIVCRRFPAELAAGGVGEYLAAGVAMGDVVAAPPGRAASLLVTLAAPSAAGCI
jgi:hypothetical protein